MSHLFLPGQIVLHLTPPNVSYILQILQTALASSGRLRALLVLGENLELCQSLEQMWHEAAHNLQDSLNARTLVQRTAEGEADRGPSQIIDAESDKGTSGGSHKRLESEETPGAPKLQMISLAGVEASLVALSSWLNVWIRIEPDLTRQKAKSTPPLGKGGRKAEGERILDEILLPPTMVYPSQKTITWQISLVFDAEAIARLLRSPSVAAAAPHCSYLEAADLSNHGNVLRRFWLQLLSAVQADAPKTSDNRGSPAHGQVTTPPLSPNAARGHKPAAILSRGPDSSLWQEEEEKPEESGPLPLASCLSPNSAMPNPRRSAYAQPSSDYSSPIAHPSVKPLASKNWTAMSNPRRSAYAGNLAGERWPVRDDDKHSSANDVQSSRQDIPQQSTQAVPARDPCMEEGFNYLFWEAPIGIVYESLDGGILSANPAFCRLTGYTETQLRHLDRRSISHPEDFAAEVRLIQQMLNGGSKRQILRKRYLRSDGTTVTAEVAMSLFGEEEEEESYLLSFVTDLSDRQRAELEIQQRREREALLSEISAKIRATFDFSAILQTAVKRLRQALDTDRVLAYQLLIDRSGVCVAEEVNPNYPTMKGQSFPAECIPPPYLEAYRCGRLWSVDDVRAAEITDCHRQMLDEVHVRSMIAVAIQRCDETSPSQERFLWGLLVVHHCRAPRCWTPDEQQLVQAVGNQMAIAIEQANLVHQLQAHAQELEDRVNQRTRSLEQSLKFERLSRSLTETLRQAIDEDQMLRAAVEGLGKTLGADGCYASLFDDRQEVLEVRYQHFSSTIEFQNSLVGERFSLQDWPDDCRRRLLGGKTYISDLPIEQTVDLRQALDISYSDFQLAVSLAGGDACVSYCVVSQLISPILDDRGLIGTLTVFHASPRCFDPAEIELVEQVTAQCAIAIRQARLYRQEHQQRLSAEYFRLFLEQSTDVFVEYDQQLRYLSINPAGAFLLGRPRSEIIGKTHRELIGSQADTIEPLIRQVFNTGEKVIVNHEVFIENGFRTFETVYAPIADALGTIHRVIGIGQDVTEVRRQWQQLQEQNQQLAEINRLKEEFIATTSHELRTPLTAILGFSSVLLEEPFGPLNSKQKLYVDRIHSSGQHLLELINDILDLSRIEADRLELEPQLVFIRDICESVISLIQERVANHGLTLEIEVDPDLEYMVADPRRIKQMLLNLLTNAIKFTPQGSVGLKIYRSCISSSKDISYNLSSGEMINFVVWDTGIGIDEADQLRLFSPFSQIDSSLSRQYQGTGLGLVITRKLAELHGGSISLDSSSGRGSRFTISLPLYQSPQSLMAMGSQIDRHSLHAVAQLVENLPLDS